MVLGLITKEILAMIHSMDLVTMDLGPTEERHDQKPRRDRRGA
jgi:hypothetical protein